MPNAFSYTILSTGGIDRANDGVIILDATGPSVKRATVASVFDAGLNGAHTLTADATFTGAVNWTLTGFNELPHMVPVAVGGQGQHKLPPALSERRKELRQRRDRRIDDDRFAPFGVADQCDIRAERPDRKDEQFSAHPMALAFAQPAGWLRG